MREKLYSQLGEAVRRHRDSLGMSQAALAEKIGVGRTSVTMMERGSQAVFVHQLMDIAAALKTQPEQLLADLKLVRDREPETSSVASLDMAELLSGLDRRVMRITR